MHVHVSNGQGELSKILLISVTFSQRDVERKDAHEVIIVRPWGSGDHPDNANEGARCDSRSCVGGSVSPDDTRL